MPFELLTMTPCKINGVNSRMEKHGKDDLVPAVDISISIDAPNAILEQLQPGLLEALYYCAEEGNDDDQDELDGIDPVSHLPNLRFPRLAYPIGHDMELVGYTLTVDHGLGGKSNLVLGTCNVNKVRIDPKEGGTVALKFRVQCDSGLTEKLLGKLSLLIQHEVAITLEPPVPAEEAPPQNPMPFDADKGEPVDPFARAPLTPEQALADSLAQEG